jgi:N-acetylmuramoyl-L-alanine amidase
MMRILIDNGHGYDTQGKRSPLWDDGSQLSEWSWTREMATRIEQSLRTRRVLAQRLVPESQDVSLRERCLRVNRLSAAYGPENCLLVSLHVNASPDGEGQGWEIHTCRGQTVSDVYATLFWKEAEKRLSGLFRMRGDHTDSDPDWDSNLAILRDTVCPAVLTENLFMDRREECRFLLSEQGKQCITELHVTAICKIVALQKHFP